MIDVVIPYNTMPYDIVKPPSNCWPELPHQRRRLQLRVQSAPDLRYCLRVSAHHPDDADEQHAQHAVDLPLLSQPWIDHARLSARSDAGILASLLGFARLSLRVAFHARSLHRRHGGDELWRHLWEHWPCRIFSQPRIRSAEERIRGPVSGGCGLL